MAVDYFEERGVHFVCHAPGLQHSFTYDQTFQADGEVPGGYGHPHGKAISIDVQQEGDQFRRALPAM